MWSIRKAMLNEIRMLPDQRRAPWRKVALDRKEGEPKQPCLPSLRDLPDWTGGPPAMESSSGKSGGTSRGPTGRGRFRTLRTAEAGEHPFSFLLPALWTGLQFSPFVHLLKFLKNPSARWTLILIDRHCVILSFSVTT